MKRGFPRPLAYIEKTTRSPYAKDAPRGGSYGKKWDDRSYPHPYTASDSHPAKIDTTRLARSIKRKLCGVCGEYVKGKEVGLILYNPKSPKISSGADWVHSESGPYHLKCLNIAFKSCPHLADTKLYMPGYGTWADVKPIILRA